MEKLITDQEKFLIGKTKLEKIQKENKAPEAFRDFFSKEAGFLLMLSDHMGERYDRYGRAKPVTKSFEELRAWNGKIYEDIRPENYGTSYGNPDYAAEKLGPEYGPLFGWLYAELRGMIPMVYEYRPADIAVLLDLFAGAYDAFSAEQIPAPEAFRQMIYDYNFEHCAQFTAERIAEFVDPSLDYAKKIIMDSDLTDLRYLFSYGMYISGDEIKTAEHLLKLSQDEIDAMARTYTEGYRKGFENAGIDLSKKKTVNIRFRAGFERMIRSAIMQFAEMGLDSVIYRTQYRSLDSWSPRKNGYEAGEANPQYDFDHTGDHGLYLDEKLMQKKLKELENAYESMKTLANTHAGPAVLETFGAEPFEPESKDTAVKLSDAQQKLMVQYNSEAGQITKKYIIGEERSFTIIAFPIPSIGPDYEEIFNETVRINTLDYKTYQDIQQKLIDALDQGERVVIKGKNGNRTDLTVALADLADPAKQTKFENCVADVNIPVGEVFTSPKLAGTNGTLHVKQVYLEGLNYLDLEIRITDGMISDYSCANFDTAEKGRKYIEENILFMHETLPIGEFAIGTNTTAYEVQNRFGIQAKMPILIYEKTGPHFAFGDTCFSWQEELHTFNPDGKEIMAKDNECSILRKTDISKAYFNCHTDITIPYDELGYIKVIKKNGEEIPIIEDGMFVLPGCGELNKPLEKMGGLGD